MFSLNTEALEKMKGENKTQRDVHVKNKFGDDTGEVNLKTNSTGRGFGEDDFDKGRTSMKFTVDPLHPIPHIVEWYAEGKGNGVNPFTFLKINGVEVDTFEAKKNGGGFHKSKGVYEFTPSGTVDQFGNNPVTFEIDLDRPGKGKVKMKQGAILVYAVNEYVPPPRPPIDPITGLPI